MQVLERLRQVKVLYGQVVELRCKVGIRSVVLGKYKREGEKPGLTKNSAKVSQAGT